MASTAAERKAKQRKEWKDQGLIRKDFWLKAETVLVLEQYKREYSLNDTEVINHLVASIKKGS